MTRTREQRTASQLPPCASWLRSCRPSSPTTTGEYSCRNTKPIPRNFLQKRNHEIFAMRFVASLMPAKFTYYDRGVELSQHKNDSAKFFAIKKSRNFCHALRRLTHAGQVLLLRQRSRDVAKPIPRNFMRKRNQEIFALHFVASLMPAKFS